jgi:hypothetical protein
MNRLLFVIISSILFVFGLIIIASSVNWGSAAASAYIRAHGGSVDTAQFTILLQEYINLYRWAGSIMSIIGGLGVVKAIELGSITRG